MRDIDIDRFHGKVDRRGDDECWNWSGTIVSTGYGAMKVERKMLRAHRIAWTLARGEIPAGFGVLHRCDNPPCVNPAHLFLGTTADNMADMRAKGREARGDSHGTHTKPESLVRGDAHWSRVKPERLARGDQNGARTRPETRARGSGNGNSKLTEDMVRAIRAAALTESQESVARRFGVNQTCVSLIVRRVTWRQVT